MTDKYLNVCPYCNGMLTIDVYQGVCEPGCVRNATLTGSRLYYSVCRSCGSVVRSYLKPGRTPEEKTEAPNG